MPKLYEANLIAHSTLTSSLYGTGDGDPSVEVVICGLPMAGWYGIIHGSKGVADCGADVMGYTGVFSPMQRKKKRG